MEENTKSTQRRAQRGTLKNVIPLFFIALIVLLVSLYFLLPQKDTNHSANSADSAYSAGSTNSAETERGEQPSQSPSNHTAQPPNNTLISQNLGPEQNTITLPPVSLPSGKDKPENSVNHTPQNSSLSSPAAPESPFEQHTPPFNALPAQATVPPEVDLCKEESNSITGFFETLDTRDYIRDFELDKSSSIYFPELIQKLLDNPPVVTGETDDLFTILQNTAHFFRIIGKKNIFVLKGILDREKDTFEQILYDFYKLSFDQECLKNTFNLVIGQDALYHYSGFFLNTMGGRLYLFRRDSMSRMIVSFYAILVLEQANREGRNIYGIDIKEPIDKLIDEIESSSLQLKLRDYYLDTLYDMKERYN